MVADQYLHVKSAATCRSALQAGAHSTVQQQHWPQVQHVLSAHQQSSLLAPILQVLQGRPRAACSHWPSQQQLWPSQCRALHTTAAVCGSRDKVLRWPSAVPPLHQPNKHVLGTKPLQSRPAEALLVGQPSTPTAQEALSGTQHTAQPVRESLIARHRAAIVATGLFISTAAACKLPAPSFCAGPRDRLYS